MSNKLEPWTSFLSSDQREYCYPSAISTFVKFRRHICVYLHSYVIHRWWSYLLSPCANLIPSSESQMANFLKYVSAKYLLAIAIVGLCFVPPTCAHDNGMDMTMDGAMSLAEGQMLPYLHFTPGDNLWFLGWVPASTGAMVGTCIGLFLLALVERWVATCRAVMEVHWRKRAQIIQSDRMNLPVSADSKGQQTPSITSVRSAITMRGAPPFIFAHDITRGILHVGQTALQFAFMLAVMTFQVGFIFAIVVGLGVGEALFGRYASHASHLA